MFIGQKVLAKHENKVIECEVIRMDREDVILKYAETTFSRKYWEIRKVQNEKEQAS